MQHRISFSQNATLELLMAGLEAFNGAKLTGHPTAAVETLGHLWGFRRVCNDQTLHIVDHISVSALASRSPDEVSSDDGVFRLKCAITDYIRPELTFLGDFHTHPYQNKAEATNARGWEYSQGDKECLMQDDFFWKLSDNQPLMIILAVCKLERVRENEQHLKFNHVLQFNIAEYRFYLGGYIGHADTGTRSISKTSRSNVEIAMLPLEIWSGPPERLDYFALQD